MNILETSVSTQWFIFCNDQLLLKKESNNTYSIFSGETPPIAPLPHHVIHTVTLPTGDVVKSFSIDHPVDENSRCAMVALRASYDLISLPHYRAAGKCYQILYWDSHSRYCSVCGTATKQEEAIMKKCPDCGHEMYPPISTAVIVLVRKENEILLIRARNFRGTHFGLVAGFLEAGETLEQCVAREVMEETGLKIKNIAYFGNQPWPYPSGLMVGFIADYESGEIKIQKEELTEAAFFSEENLPEIPRKLSIARKLIDWWLEGNKQTDCGKHVQTNEQPRTKRLY